MTTQADMSTPRDVLVLARNDHEEAMRVASGLTIFGHSVTLVIMHQAPEASDAMQTAIELLELADIEPVTTVPALQEELALVDSAWLGEQMHAAHAVVNL